MESYVLKKDILLNQNLRAMGFSGSYVSIIHRRPQAREVFSELKKSRKHSLFKYGAKFGKGEFVLDTQRMKNAERAKNRRGYFIFLCVLFFGLMGSYSVFKFVIAPRIDYSLEIHTEAKYYWEDHGSNATLREMQSMWVVEQGYVAWGEGDYEKAIWFFEHSEGARNYWWRREFALVGVYGERCDKFKKDCIKYEAYRNILKDDTGIKVPEGYKEKYYQEIIKYNRKMIAYFKD